MGADELQVLQPGLAIFEGFANVAFVYGRGELLVVDTGYRGRGADAVSAIRSVTLEPITLITYTHGHIDHVSGTPAFLADAAARGHARPVIWAHERLCERQRTYVRMAGWTATVNSLQFNLPIGPERISDPSTFTPPDRTYRDVQRLYLAGEPVELHHARGETDDATWIWLPERRSALVGDLVVSSMPNAGNPGKRQRFTLEWAEALESIATLRPHFILPGHGPAWQGDIALQVLRDTAAALRFVHDEVVRRLNRGEWPVDIIEAEIGLPSTLANKPWLREAYGCVAFVVRDVLRSYGGWWSGQPSHLFPPRRNEYAGDILALCGRAPLLARVRALLRHGCMKRAVALAELVVSGIPDDREARLLYAESLRMLARTQQSFIARNLLRGAAARAVGHWGEG
jgi:alkyl sulfatase BDS1-like metallo-beta-lactamase superfamily hydrolase